jgi:putative intracellular protease/amidase
MRFGDVLIRVDGEPVTARSKAQLLDFEWDMTIRPAGEEVSFTVLRGTPGEREEVTFTGVLEELPRFPAFGRHLGQLPEHYYETLGLGVEMKTELHDIIHQIPEGPDGVFIKTVDEGSVASRADLKRGDVIYRIDGTETPDIESFRSVLDRALAKGESEILVEATRDRLLKRTALAPDYLMRNRKILLVAPAGENPDADVIFRELWAMGAEVILATPGGADIPRVTLDTPLKADLGLDKLTASDLDLLLIIDGPGAEAFEENQDLLEIIREVQADDKKVLAFVGATALLPVLASEDPLTAKITMPSEVSGRAVSLGANYTGNAVESEENLVTTTGVDRDVIREFLRTLANLR